MTKVVEYNIYNGAIRWWISTAAKVIWCIFSISSTVSGILAFQICYLINLGQGQGVQHLQWSYSITKINLYKWHTWAVFAVWPFSRYSHFKMRDLENVGQFHDAQHSQWYHSMAITCFLSDGNSNICIISHICEIFAKLIKWQQFDVGMEDKVKEKNETYTIRLEMFDSL